MTSDNSVVTEGVDVLVIGGGQAGLAMGYYLAERGLSFVIADANPEVGHMWRSRWQSLKLFTAGQYNDLPGMRFPGRAGYAIRARTTSPTSFGTTRPGSSCRCG